MPPPKDSELIPDIMEQEPQIPNLINNGVIIDGCPVVGPDKAERLKAVLLRRCSSVGEIIYSYMPVNNKEETLGYMFIAYTSPDVAQRAVKELNNLSLDKAHTLLVSCLGDYDKSVTVNKEWVPPEKKPYQEVGNLRSWLLNKFARNQFALLDENGEKCSIFWHTNSEEQIIEEREDWSEGWIHWSSHGTYLATMHSPGVILWGGDKFERVGRFAHKNVRMIDFSPNERFMVTLSPANENLDKSSAASDMVVWDIRKGTACRNFSGTIDSWPTFKWSHDDRFVATLQGGKVYIYETETFKVLDKKPLITPVDIYDFAWSPTENIIAIWTPETNNTPARVALISVPARKELCTKNLFSVAEINLIWHPQGEFLCVQVLRCNKKKIEEDGQVKYLGTFVNFEIVRMREKLYPIDQVALKDIASVSCFCWEPTGSRFAYIATDNTGKLSVPLYEMTKAGKVREVKIFDKVNNRVNDLRWSPRGNIFVIANLKTADASITFIDANDCTTVATVDHPMACELHWDGTGRYLASVVSSFKHKSDNAVWFWTCVGRPLYHKMVTGLHIFAWRPFPPTLLTPEQISATKKNLGSKYSAMFDAEDKMLASKASREIIERRQNLASEFTAWRTGLLSRHSADKAKRDKLRGMDTDHLDAEGEEEEELEFLVSTTRQLVRREA